VLGGHTWQDDEVERRACGGQGVDAPTPSGGTICVGVVPYYDGLGAAVGQAEFDQLAHGL